MGETKNIYQSIGAIMAEIDAVGKDKFNPQQKFKYRGVDDVMNALHPLLAKHKVFCTTQVLDQTREERQTKTGGNLIYSICKVRFTFYAEDGSSVESVTIGEGMDSGDKATNKAMSIAFKYAFFQLFCIPTEEMAKDDPDGESHEVKGRRGSAARKSAQKAEATQPVEKIDETKLKVLKAKIAEAAVEEKKILDMLQIEKLEDMPLAAFKSIMNKLEVTIKARKEREEKADHE